MNVCGGHERSITMAGLRGALPPQVELIPGPGCPVCVCPEEDIYAAIQLARRDDVIVAAFGDMLRVPCNAPKQSRVHWSRRGQRGVMCARFHRPRKCCHRDGTTRTRKWCFFAAGFETTTAPVAGLIANGLNRAAAQPVLVAVRSPDLAGGGHVAGQRHPRIRRTDRPGPRLHRDGPGRMGVRAEEARHSRRRCRFRAREPAGRAVFGVAPGDRKQAVSG